MEKAGVDNRSGKCRSGKSRSRWHGWKMQEWKKQELMAWVENAGVEKAGVDSMGGKCRSKSYGTPNQGCMERILTVQPQL